MSGVWGRVCQWVISSARTLLSLGGSLLLSGGGVGEVSLIPEAQGSTRASVPPLGSTGEAEEVHRTRSYVRMHGGMNLEQAAAGPRRGRGVAGNGGEPSASVGLGGARLLRSPPNGRLGGLPGLPQQDDVDGGGVDQDPPAGGGLPPLQEGDGLPQLVPPDDGGAEIVGERVLLLGLANQPVGGQGAFAGAMPPPVGGAAAAIAGLQNVQDPAAVIRGTGPPRALRTGGAPGFGGPPGGLPPPGAFAGAVHHAGGLPNERLSPSVWQEQATRVLDMLQAQQVMMQDVPGGLGGGLGIRRVVPPAGLPVGGGAPELLLLGGRSHGLRMYHHVPGRGDPGVGTVMTGRPAHVNVGLSDLAAGEITGAPGVVGGIRLRRRGHPTLVARHQTGGDASGGTTGTSACRRARRRSQHSRRSWMSRHQPRQRRTTAWKHRSTTARSCR